MRTHLALGIVAATIIATHAPADAGLLRHFKLDEPANSVTMTDSTLNANGTFIGSPVLNGSYLTLNGIDQRAELSSAGSGIYNPAYETNRSLAMWINLDGVSGDQYLLGTTVPSGGNGWSFRLMNDGTLNLLVHGVANYFSTADSGIDAGEWAHVGYSLSGGTLLFYVNGVQLGDAVASTTAYENNGTPVISIGAGGGDPSPTSFTAGSFADFRLYMAGFGADNNDPDVANENGGVLSQPDFAALAALNPIPAPAALPAGLAMIGVLAARRRRR